MSKHESSGLEMDRRDALKVAGTSLAISLAPTALARPTKLVSQSLTGGRQQDFGQDWRFRRGLGEGLEAPGLDDTAWRKLDLPHDWSLEDLPGQAPPERIGPFDKAAEGGGSTGFTQGGEAWYRKHFRVDAASANSRVEILFEGVAVESDVWLNGQPLGRQVYAYAPFALDLTPHLVRDGNNVIAVRVRNPGRNSRWYAGSGIYRPVSIDVVPSGARLARWGVAAWTRRIAGETASVDLTIAVVGSDPGTAVRSMLIDRNGQVAAQAETSAEATVRQALEIRAPQLWSTQSPALYTLVTELVRDGAVEDRLVQDFGIRVVTIDPERGLRINGERVVLRGGCIHHDNGILGAAAFADADERKILRLKERGYNAIRSSHNPAASSLRSACDRHGMLLIEEAFDAWHVGKLPDDYARSFAGHWREHLAAMVLPARNSPSVIMWSIGNEIPERSSAEGVEWSWQLANEVRRLDPTRPVTAAINQWIGHSLIAPKEAARQGHEGETDQASTVFLDVAGYNYRFEYIEPEHQAFPKRVIYGSETFAKDAYDYCNLAQRAPYMLGEFVWTAVDYLGEVGIGIPTSGVPPLSKWPPMGFPQISAFCGDIDLIGDQKPQSLWRDVVWGVSQLELVVRRPLPVGHAEWLTDWGWSDELPSWTWPGAEGQALAVRINTSGDRVQLLLNGRKVADRAVTPADKMRVEVAVPYVPGTLEAIAWRNGREIGRRRLETTGSATKLRLSPERPDAQCRRGALSYIGVEVLDRSGRRRADDTLQVRLMIDGPAELVGFGSASPLARGSFQARETRTWQGRALAILRANGHPGIVRVEASSTGLAGDAVQLRFA